MPKKKYLVVNFDFSSAYLKYLTAEVMEANSDGLLALFEIDPELNITQLTPNKIWEPIKPENV